MMNERSELTKASRVVVKIGTRVVAEPEGGLNHDFLDQFARQIAELEQQIVVVTSGAVHLGRRALPLRRVDSVSRRQAAAAVGQPELMRHYIEALAQYELVGAQILLTTEDMSDRSRYVRISNTVHALLEEGVVPIINENDTISVEGVTFGENDKLAGMVAAIVRPDLLIFLSDQKGLCTADPRDDPQAQLVRVVRWGDNAMQYATTGGGDESLGGMYKKVLAARGALGTGIAVVIADGHEHDVLRRILDGEELGTLFVPKREEEEEPAMPARKLWIATVVEPAGEIVVDAGARRALLDKDGSSLLPVGIVAVEGRFEAGDLVRVVTEDGQEFARGLVNYSAEEVKQIQGAHTRQIPKILGHVGDEEVIHRDNMVLSGD